MNIYCPIFIKNNYFILLTFLFATGPNKPLDYHHFQIDRLHLSNFL